MNSALFHTCIPLVLASSSPRRRDFLENMGIRFRQVDSCNEPEAHDLAGEELAYHAAQAKALCVAATCPDELVLSADTVVVLDGRHFGKPHSKEHALTMLMQLCGHSHTVFTACCLVHHGEIVRLFHEATEVRLAACSPEILRAYIETGEPMDKAGAYAVQGCGSFLVERIEGSWSNVVGLPLTLLIEHLLDYGALKARGESTGIV